MEISGLCKDIDAQILEVRLKFQRSSTVAL